jgi:hypothetical protein
MTREDLARILTVGASRACIVESSHLVEAPGFVRTTTLHAGNRACVALESWGMDEGGLYFWATFPTLEAMIACIESFLARPLSQWPAHCAYPERPTPEEEAAAATRFAEMLRLGRLPVPVCGGFAAQGSSYWLQVLGGNVD